MRVLVFGGSGTVGGAVCRTLAAEGAQLVFTYHRGESLAIRLAEELPGSRALPLDVTSQDDLATTCQQAAAALGGLDAFVHCVGVGADMECAGEDSPHRMGLVDAAEWERVLAVNAGSAFFAVRELTPILEAAGGGNVVLLGSNDGVKQLPTPVHYAASRGAQTAMTHAMAKELGELGIRVNMVAPGVLEKGLSSTLPPQLLQEYEKHCGLKRRGTLDEVAQLVSWLALHNTYVTGQTIVLDGAL